MEKITIKANNFWDNDPKDQELTVVDGIVTDCKMIDKKGSDFEIDPNDKPNDNPNGYKLWYDWNDSKWESLESSEENINGRV